MPKVARWKSDGKYLGARGSTNKFQAQWLEHPASEGQTQCKGWLSDEGRVWKSVYQVHCSITPLHF